MCEKLNLYSIWDNKNENSSSELDIYHLTTRVEVKGSFVASSSSATCELATVERLGYARLCVCSTWLQYGQECSTSLQVVTQNGIEESGKRLERRPTETRHISAFPEVTTITATSESECVFDTHGRRKKRRRAKTIQTSRPFLCSILVRTTWSQRGHIISPGPLVGTFEY